MLMEAQANLSLPLFSVWFYAGHVLVVCYCRVQKAEVAEERRKQEEDERKRKLKEQVGRIRRRDKVSI